MNRRTFLVGSASLGAASVVSRRTLAADPLPPTSQLYVREHDPVAYMENGVWRRGSPTFGHRDGYNFQYFATVANREKFVNEKNRQWAVEQPATLAFGGADIVERYPEGVRRNVVRPLIAGNSAVTQWYNGAIYRFVSLENRAKFARAIEEAKRTGDPMIYGLPVGEYCLGAMKADNITPGNPNHRLFLVGVGIDAVFGSERGPLVWVDMTPDEQYIGYVLALQNYHRRVYRPGERDIARG